MEACNNKIERIIDANFNRAREGLRVVEDAARFILNNEYISKRIKDIRSHISIMQKQYKKTINSRDTKSDVGVLLNSKTEEKRDSIIDIIEANTKRAQEALRVLEEIFKLCNIEFSKRFKQLRYESYILEKELLDEFKGYE